MVGYLHRFNFPILLFNKVPQKRVRNIFTR